MSTRDRVSPKSGSGCIERAFTLRARDSTATGARHPAPHTARNFHSHPAPAPCARSRPRHGADVILDLVAIQRNVRLSVVSAACMSRNTALQDREIPSSGSRRRSSWAIRCGCCLGQPAVTRIRSDCSRAGLWMASSFTPVVFHRTDRDPRGSTRSGATRGCTLLDLDEMGGCAKAVGPSPASQRRWAIRLGAVRPRPPMSSDRIGRPRLRRLRRAVGDKGDDGFADHGHTCRGAVIV